MHGLSSLPCLTSIPLPPSSLPPSLTPFPPESWSTLSTSSKSCLMKTFPLSPFPTPALTPYHPLLTAPPPWPPPFHHFPCVLPLPPGHSPTTTKLQEMCGNVRGFRLLIGQIRVQIPTLPISDFMTSAKSRLFGSLWRGLGMWGLVHSSRGLRKCQSPLLCITSPSPHSRDSLPKGGIRPRK